MSRTEPKGERYRGPTGYAMVAGVRGQEVLLYQQFGSYSGEWMMLARTPEAFFVYKDSYGSCSGCDDYEAQEFDERWDDADAGLDMAACVKFAEGYKHFVEIPRQTMRNMVANGTLTQVLPANIRDDYSDVDLPGFARDMALCTKLSEGMDVTAQEILDAPNQELKQRALRRFGYERFVAEVEMEEVHCDGEDALLRKGDVVFAYVKDSSTPRRYLLRVPPTSRTVREAIAWTFGMTVHEYRPLAET